MFSLFRRWAQTLKLITDLPFFLEWPIFSDSDPPSPCGLHNQLMLHRHVRSSVWELHVGLRRGSGSYRYRSYMRASEQRPSCKVLLDHHPEPSPTMPLCIAEVQWSEEHLRRQDRLLGATLRYLGTLNVGVRM